MEACKKMGNKIIMLVVICTAAGLLTSGEVFPSTPVVKTFSGKAVNPSGRLEYTERHVVVYQGERVLESRTEYFDPADRKIGELRSRFVDPPQHGSYEFRDLRASYEDGATVLEETIRLFRRENPAEEVETVDLKKSSDQIIGQGFHYFIRERLGRIAKGEVFHVKLALPSRLEAFEFRIRKHGLEGDRLQVRLEIDNWFLRLFAPHVEADYSLSTGRLLRYNGIANLADETGRHPTVTITYNYP
jgi:hypothetical protein